MSYLGSMVTSQGLTSDNMNTIGGGAFWENKDNWLKHDVRFNADSVEAAILFVDMIGVESGARLVKDLAAPTMAALQANHRPFDYLFLNGAGHTIEGAPQRKAAMDLNVDWMNFWLQGKEDPDPAKAEQYKRWRMIRDKNEQRKAEEAKNKNPAGSTTTASSTPTPQPQSQSAVARTAPGPTATIPDEAAIQRVKEELKAAGIPEPQNIYPLNVMAYREMYVEKDMVKAEKLFRWNLILFPNRRGTSSITDSMAEYYLQAGNIEKAIEFYTRSLELGPNFPSKAKQIIQRLKADPSSIGAIQEELRQDYISFTKSNPGE
jgi:tetratricopeptide (TPR) repeat protein